MIRLLNVYYPTRTVVLLLCEAVIVGGCFLAAARIEFGDQMIFALQLEDGALKIGVLTIVSLILLYYFDLYEPTIVSGRMEIYFRILLVLLPIALSSLPFCWPIRRSLSAGMSTSGASHC